MSGAASTAQFLDRIRTKTRATLASALGATEVAVLDYPAHHNVGDHLIWLGQRDYLRGLGVRIRYQADARAYSPQAVRSLPRSVPILLQGGGNFGDLWPEIQSFRERVVAEHPERRIVQAPQSIYFADQRRARSADRVLGAHPDFVLLVRERESIARAVALLPSVRVDHCPDLALGWRPPLRRRGPGGHVLVLARRDTEAGPAGLAENVAEVASAASVPVVVDDWGLRGVRLGAWNLGRLPAVATDVAPLLAAVPGANRLVAAGFTVSTAAAVGSAVRSFERARLVVTDRLHAHVLAGLMGVPHIVLDNSYGKVAAIHGEYTHGFLEGVFARDLDQVRASMARVGKNGVFEAR